MAIDAFDFPETLSSLHQPIIHDIGRGRIEVYPRLADPTDVAFDLGEEATFDARRGAFLAPAGAVSDWPISMLPASLRAVQKESTGPTRVLEAPEAETAPEVARILNPTTPEEAAYNASVAPGIEGYEREIDILTAAVGDVPDWFGMDPYPYQRIGALCIAAGGRRLLADAPGLGKSVQAILAGVLLGARRWIVVCPPVAQSNWAAEIERRRVPENLHPEAGIAVIRPGRKVPEPPPHRHGHRHRLTAGRAVPARTARGPPGAERGPADLRRGAPSEELGVPAGQDDA
ncbi:hypothetical protein [Brachybacterium sp. GPGPB12]|uniref:hypothetical protein n=1 Tax=Brachybacterium sp. GPGPB12 TaxID=3023517 RepID=UPI0031343CFD